jgi:hypothetical protein
MIEFRRVLMLAGTLSCNAFAYEQATHALLTSVAFDVSYFSVASGSPDSLSDRLGLNTYAPFGDDKTYFERVATMAGTAEFLRATQLFESRILADLFKSSEDPPPIQRWLMNGAIREDDNPSEDPPTPQDVAPGLRRPLHHFYDPQFNRPLTNTFLFSIDSDVHKNPDWAIGAIDSFADPNKPELLRRNSFAVMDGRESMFRALTLMTNSAGAYVDISSGKDSLTKQQWRRAYWATTFRAVGDVLHLNQDMAQPQHTRNEAHSGKYCATASVCLTGHTSVYEKYINARALKEGSFNSLAPFHGTLDIAVKPLPLTSYPIPAFANYADYWSTAPGAPLAPGKGLADYSNRGFFTAAKNFGSLEYALPSSNSSDYQIRTVVPRRWDDSTSIDTTPVHIYYGQVRDDLQQTSTPDVALTTFGMWDQFLKAKSIEPAYSLNRVNYDAMADLLLPRAVAYSAGLINFFFRGRIDIALPDEGVFALADHASNQGFKIVRAKIRNATPAFTDAQGGAVPQGMAGGTFFAVIRYHTDKQYVDSLDTIVGTSPCADYSSVVNAVKLDASTQCRDGIEQIIVSRPLAGVSLGAGEQKEADFDFSDSPIPYGMTDVVLQIVYRGPLGSETDAVAVGTIDVSEPTYFTFQNASDYIHIGEHVYTRGEVNASPTLLAQVQPQYCVDYRQSPPQLTDQCLKQFALDLTVSFADLSKPIAQVVDLPSRRFMRLVYLTVADEGFNPPVMKKAAPTIKVTAHRHGSENKALLYQDGTCVPHDPFDIPPRHSQMTVVSSNTIGYRVDQLDKLRGVNGWFSTSCVINGDNSMPGAPDDRVRVMAPLVPLSEEVQPFAVSIMGDYL